MSHRLLILFGMAALAGCTSAADSPDGGAARADGAQGSSDAGNGSQVDSSAPTTDTGAGAATDTGPQAGADAGTPPRTDAGTPPAADSGTTAGTRSAGCGMPSTLTPATWVMRTLMVGGASREYYVWLPTGYDPTRAYPIVYQFHGCSSGANRQDNNVPVQTQSGSNAIVVRGKAAAMCWDTATMGPDVPYVDALLPAIESAFCVDTGRRFAAGYSSGSFMTHRLACIRGAQFRGVASIAGGQSGNNCTGNVAALLIHDSNDTTVNISASVQARDNHVMRNGCSATAARTPTTPMPCEAYTGCMAALPVVWCQTSGRNHDRQDALAGPAFWGFFSSLMAR